MPTIENLTIFGNKIAEEKDQNLGAVITYEIEGGTRDNSKKINIPLKDNVIELELEDGSTWMCDADSLHEVYPEIDPALPTTKTRGSNKEFVLPETVSRADSERGIIGKIAVKYLKLLIKKQVAKGIGKLALSMENKLLHHAIVDSKGGWTPTLKKRIITDGGALLRIDHNFSLLPFKNREKNKPYLLFIHGTNSDTYSAFEGLMGTSTWHTIHQIYGENVIGFQHRTLTQSPLQNVLNLLSLLPKNAEVHLITHSRGGLVGDVLSKYHAGNKALGFSNEQIDFLKQEEDREHDIEAISALNKLAESQQIKVTKFIRVACPAAGTTLVSKRLDTYFNVLGNLFAKGPVLDTVKELLHYCVSHKDDTAVLPGVEAQNPDSPFQQVLNHPILGGKINGQSLLVISGSSQASFSKRGLLTILGKLFFWKRNDLVVDTSSMYLGASREGNIQYFFDEGSHVDHFSFFSNPSSNGAIELALTSTTAKGVPGFQETTQLTIPEEQRALEYGELKSLKPPSGNRPIVVLLPGIMGSNLYQRGKELWLNYGRILTGGLLNLNYNSLNTITADSVVKTSYGKLHKHLSKNYDVVVYPFDWRRPLNETAKDFNEKIKELLKLEQPIKIVGHSMGGVLVRDFIIDHDTTWKKLNNSQGFQLVFLGSPLGGSHRILTVLFGKDGIIRKLAGLDIINGKRRLLKMFKEFPGILSLLPLKNANDDFASPAVWKAMSAVFGRKNWPLPSDEILAELGKYQANVLSKLDGIDYSNMNYIAGLDKMTPCGYYLDKKPPKKLYFLYTGQGDQSVTWELGIPKPLKEQDSVYYTRVSHGALANDPSLFSGIDELLEKGTTALLSTTPPLTRSDEKVFRAEPSFDFDLSEEGLENTLFGGEMAPQHERSKLPLTISVSKGHLRYAKYPLLAGHFINDGVLYAEKAIDSCLNGQLRNSHSLGLYPGAIGTHEFFRADPKTSDYKGAVILGIGEPDKLTSFQLAKTVERGVLNYLLEAGKDQKQQQELGISSLLIASGFGGLSTEGSIRGIVQGINNANDKIRQLISPTHPIINFLEFIELYSDRALSCMYAIRKMIERDDKSLNIRLGNTSIKKLLGYRNRIPLDYSQDWWKRISIRHNKPNGNEKLESFVFSVTTGDSREEESELFKSSSLIDGFIEEISLKNKWEKGDAQTLFELLIPNKFKNQIKQKGNVSLLVDGETAGYPWELLQDGAANTKPLCINAGFIRQLAINHGREVVKRANNNLALVVADPLTDGFLTQLPGALEEGKQLHQLLEDKGYKSTPLFSSNASEIIRALYSENYSIIHLAGHGIFNPASPLESGMVIGDDQFLTVFQIQQLPVVPDLVFVNCCHLGFTDSNDERFYQERYRLAANIGSQLIQIGVKAVIASGWAVHDGAALLFANKFYGHMFDGYTFGDAVKNARNAVYEEYRTVTNTWGAYQCYGDPFFRLKDYSGGKYMPNYIVPEEVEVDLENLYNNMQIGQGDSDWYLEQLETIFEAAKKSVAVGPRIKEKVAEIYQEIGDYEKANAQYAELLRLEKADFSMKAMEKHSNISIKLFVNQYLESLQKGEILAETSKKISDIIDDLNVLLHSGETCERLNLLGSGFKRLSMVALDKEERITNLKSCQEKYEGAHLHSGNGNKAYTITNVLETACILSFLKGTTPHKKLTVKVENIKNSKDAITALEKVAEEVKGNKTDNDLSYWDMVALANVNFTRTLLQPKINNHLWDKVASDFEMLWQKAGSEAKKKTEMEQLQFLILTLHKAKTDDEASYLELLAKTSQQPEDLGINLSLLRDVLESLMN